MTDWQRQGANICKYMADRALFSFSMIFLKHGHESSFGVNRRGQSLTMVLRLREPVRSMDPELKSTNPSRLDGFPMSFSYSRLLR